MRAQQRTREPEREASEMSGASAAVRRRRRESPTNNGVNVEKGEEVKRESVTMPSEVMTVDGGQGRAETSETRLGGRADSVEEDVKLSSINKQRQQQHSHDNNNNKHNKKDNDVTDENISMMREDLDVWDKRTVFMRVITLTSLFIIATLTLQHIWLRRPPLTLDDLDELRESLPTNWQTVVRIKDVNNLKRVFAVLIKYRDAHTPYLLCILSYVYLYFQAFPLFLFWCPGTGTAISLLVCSFYGFWRGLIICLLLSATGPALAFSLSSFAARPIVRLLFASKLRQFKSHIQENQHDLFGYVVFLRLTPLFPNFFINVASPCLGLPFKVFFLGTVVGLIPNTVMLVIMGTTLKELRSLDQGLTSVLLLGVLGFAVLLPKYLRKRFSSNSSQAP